VKLLTAALLLAALLLLTGKAQAKPRYSCKALKGEGKPFHVCRENWYADWTRSLLRERQLMARHQRSSIVSAIRLGARAYGQSSSTLIRKASCESHLWPYAHNPSGASGLFQFLPSTWASTPFSAFSIWNPFAQSLAAAWMHRAGRGGEWACS
jgi:hypothetical protein